MNKLTFAELKYIEELARACGQSLRLVMQPDQDSVGEPVEYEENLELRVPFLYNAEKDKIEFNLKHEHFSAYDLNFVQAHELSHRMDALEYKAYKKPFY